MMIWEHRLTDARLSGPESKAILKTMPSIMEYVDRIHERYFKDYEKWS